MMSPDMKEQPIDFWEFGCGSVPDQMSHIHVNLIKHRVGKIIIKTGWEMASPIVAYVTESGYWRTNFDPTVSSFRHVAFTFLCNLLQLEFCWEPHGGSVVHVTPLSPTVHQGWPRHRSKACPHPHPGSDILHSITQRIHERLLIHLTQITLSLHLHLYIMIGN
jgi:hypothetical protein